MIRFLLIGGLVFTSATLQAQARAAVNYETLDDAPASEQPASEGATTANGGLIAGGAVMLGIGYVLNIAVSGVAVAAIRGTPSEYFLYSLIPIAGPFLQGFGTDVSDIGVIWGLIDGLVQLAGTAMIIIGAVSRRPVQQAPASPVAAWTVYPVANPERLGVGISGWF